MMPPFALPVVFVETRHQWAQVTTLAELSPVGRTALACLKDIANLPQGWDGRNSPPLTPKARSVAANLLKVIDFDVVPAPHVAPVAGGGVQFEWLVNGRELEIEIHSSGQLAYLATQNDDTVAAGETDGVRGIALLIRWLANA